MEDPQSSYTGQRFGRYILLDRIGAGGMAEVFRAVVHGMEGFQRTFVLKRIRPDQTTSRAFVEMFVNEARISALLNHQNIVQIYDFGQVDGCYFLTMEYLRGKDLSTVLRRLHGDKRALAPAIAANIAAQVAQGLFYAHSLTLASGEALNIVHRDVTPSNIMLLRSGGVKLLDFGIAKARGGFAGGEATETGVCKGKLPYLAPEQVRGQTLDRRTDIFALGVVLWESIVGRRLFLGKTDFDTMKNVLERPIPPPSAVRPECPTALDFVVVRALERDPDRRYQNAKAMADDLDRVLQDMRYHSQSLPRLLDDLFGEDTNQIEVPLAALPMLDASGVTSMPPPDRGVRPSSQRKSVAVQPAAFDPTAQVAARGGLGRKLVLGAALSGCALSLGLALWSGRRVPAPPSSPPIATPAPRPPAPPAPSVQAESALPATTLPPPPGAAPAVMPASPGPIAPESKRRRTGARAASGRGVGGRIQQGLSIDPFEEARTRAPKEP